MMGMNGMGGMGGMGDGNDDDMTDDQDDDADGKKPNIMLRRHLSQSQLPFPIMRIHSLLGTCFDCNFHYSSELDGVDEPVDVEESK